MAGHSKFANIKHKKEKEDSKRGKLFTKLAKEICIAVKLHGKNIEFNPRLRLAIDKAKNYNMPKDNIERAIKKGSGQNDNEMFEISYEGYAPYGVSLIIDTLTDNKNRTASEIRHAFNKFNGSMSDVAWNFDKKGVIVTSTDMDEDRLIETALDAGAEDVVAEEGHYIILTDPLNLYKVDALLTFDRESSIQMIPKTQILLSEEELEVVEKMLSHIENLEDVQEVHHNFKS